jgi:hypothetical protein
MAQIKKKNKNFSRNLFIFFLFIVIAGITFSLIDQQQSYIPRAQTDPVPTFGTMGDCQTNGNCPTALPSQATDEIPNTNGDTQPTGDQASPTASQNGITEQLISLIRQLIELLSGSDSCPTPAATPTGTGDTIASQSGVLTANRWGGRGHRRGHWRGERHERGRHNHERRGWHKHNCPSNTGPSDGTTAQPTDVSPQAPSASPSAGSAACGNPGDAGNEMGVGKYCTKGGGQCQGTQAPYCSLDVKTDVPGICSKPCATAADCGTGSICTGSGLEMGCAPAACGEL